MPFVITSFAITSGLVDPAAARFLNKRSFGFVSRSCAENVPRTVPAETDPSSSLRIEFLAVKKIFYGAFGGGGDIKVWS